MEIPSELLEEEILVRLPVKKLLQLRCVCKSWCSLISSPSFISAVEYQDKNTNNINPDSPVLFTYRLLSESKMRSSLYIDLSHPQPQPIAEVEFPLRNNGYDSYHVIGYCNGLLCFYTDFKGMSLFRCVLWNCSIRKYFRVPEPYVYPCEDLSRYVVGFGSHYQDHKYEFKILRMAYLKGKRFPVADIYHLSTNSWKRIQSSIIDTVCCVVDTWSSSQAFLHEALHWIAEFDNGKKVILVFHIGDEVFSEMEVPESVANPVDYGKLSLFVRNYRQTRTWMPTLCLVELNPPEAIEGHLVFCVCYIWVMKEYGVVHSWVKQFAVDIRHYEGLGRVGGLARVYDFKGRGQILIETVREGLISYCTESHSIKSLGIHDYCAVTPYKESLFLLNM